MADKNRILVVAPVPFFVDRGTPMRILEESLALERLGADIQIATYHIGRCIKDIENDSNIKVRRIVRLLFWYNKKEAGPNWQKIVLDILLAIKVIRICWSEKPDIIHAHLHEGVLIGSLAQKVLFWRKMKLVADFHGQLVSEMTSHGYLREGWLKKFFLFLEKVIFSMGDWTIVSSEELKKIVCQFKKRNRDKLSVVLDGVNLKKYELLKKISEVKSTDKLKVIYSGAFVKNKGIDLLLETIIRVKETNRDDILFILAGGPIENIASFVEKYDLRKIVKIISPLDYRDLPKVNLMGDIAVDPKLSGFGQASGKILQYMAAGLPVICFDRKNNRNYLRNAGFYVRDFSVDGLTEAVLHFANNKDKITEMSRNAEKEIARFSWDKSGEKILKIYKKMLMKG